MSASPRRRRGAGHALAGGLLGLALLALAPSARVTFAGKALAPRADATSLAGSTKLFAGSEASFRCGVHAFRSLVEAVPRADSRVVVVLAPKKGKAIELFRGKTGKDGLVDLRFRVPDLEAGTYTLKITTTSAGGAETITREVQVVRSARVLLTSDKPVYQPGQTIHLRALALRQPDLAPVADRDLVFEVEDGKGNKVYKREVKSSAFGIASADFVLADEVNEGDYRLRILLGEDRFEKTVNVKRYVLPKFRTTLKADKTFYLPKETLRGELQVDYFFGKPVAGAKVKVTASTFDVAFQGFHTWEGKTDARGHLTFSIRLPDRFVGTPLAKGNALVKLEAKVTDTADHSEVATRTYPVSDQAIRVTALPEAGRLVPDVENTLYVAALYPDGTPAPAAIDLWLGREARGKPFASVKADAAGLALVKVTPKASQFRDAGWRQRKVEFLGGTVQDQWGPSKLFDITARARDARGAVAKTTTALTGEPFGENVLLRLDKALYKGGEVVDVAIHTTAGMPTVYLDVVRNGQTMLTRWLPVKDGKASTRLDLPASVFGTLEVHAYQVLASGEIVRDGRVVHVAQANELQIAVRADRDVYRPGKEGEVRFTVTDRAGKPTPAALGVLIVDEAVYAMQEMQPGLEKVFFTLQQELITEDGVSKDIGGDRGYRMKHETFWERR